MGDALIKLRLDAGLVPMRTCWGLPKQSNVESLQRLIITDQLRAFDERLRGKHAIKRVAMILRKLPGQQGMFARKRKDGKLICRHQRIKIMQKPLHAQAFADPSFGRNFPSAGAAD